MSCWDMGLEPADAAPHGSLSFVQMAVAVRFEAWNLEHFKQAEDRQMMYGKLISNRAKNCSQCRPNSPAQLSSIYFHPIQSI